jgi:hypothetical protein
LAFPLGGVALAYDADIGVITTFSKMDYSEGFDCDDYAYCCQWELSTQGLNAWQVSIDMYEYGRTLLIESRPRPEWVHERFCYVDGAGGDELLCWSQFGTPAVPPSYIDEMTSPQSHVLNIVETDHGDANFRRFCFYEPQVDESSNCWLQAATEPLPAPPQSAVDAMASWFGNNFYAESNSVLEVTIDRLWAGGHSECAGEEVFTESEELVEEYEESTGYDAPPDEAVHTDLDIFLELLEEMYGDSEGDTGIE